MEIKEMINEILQNKKVDEFHIKYWDKTVDEEGADECIVKIDMEKEFI